MKDFYDYWMEVFPDFWEKEMTKSDHHVIQFEIEYEYDENGNRQLTKASRERAAKALNDAWDEMEREQDQKK